MRIQKLKQTSRFFLSDGGLETFLIFDKGYELPCFSAAVLLETDQGRADLRAYYRRFIDIAKASGRGFILDAPTWRAGTAWAGPLGLTLKVVMETNRRAVSFVSKLRAAHTGFGRSLSRRPGRAGVSRERSAVRNTHKKDGGLIVRRLKLFGAMCRSVTRRGSSSRAARG